MAEKVVLPEDFLRIGRPAANRKSVLSAILETFSGDDAVRGVGATSAPLTDEARTAALSTRLEPLPEDFGVDLGGVRLPAPARPDRKKVAHRAETGEGFYEWKDERGVLHVTDKPETAPANAVFKPFEKPALGVGGAKLFGEVTPETVGATIRAGETDQQREDRMISEIVKETGATKAEATQAFRESRSEISGKPTAPETFEEKTVLRNKIVQNTQRLLRQNPEARNEILKQAGQLMRLRGVSDIKKPEQTISTEIEGQQVDIPMSKYDPKKHGKGASRGDVSTVVTNFEAVTGANPSDRTTDKYQKDFFKWREKLTGKKPKSIDDVIFDVYIKTLKSDPFSANDPATWKEIEDGIRTQAKRLRKQPPPAVRGVGVVTAKPPTVSPSGGRKPLSAFGS